MASHQLMAAGDTEFIAKVAARPAVAHAEGPPFWRRASLLGVSGALFVAALVASGWWSLEMTEPGTKPNLGRTEQVMLFFLSAMVLFGFAVFRDYADRRARATERLVRNLLFFKHDETREEMQRMVDEGMQYTREQLTGAVQHMTRHSERQMQRAEGLIDEQLAALDAHRAAILSDLAENRQQFLTSILALEQVIPELLRQREWVGYAQRVRESVEEDHGVGSGNVSGRYPVQRAHRLGPLRAVPSRD